MFSKLKKALPHLVEGAEYAGASFVFGYVQNKYREKASIGPLPLDLAAGLAATAAGIGMQIWGKGKSLAPHITTVGFAGLGAFAHTLGAGYGAQASGVKRLLVSAEDVKKVQAVLPGKVTVLGAIPKAPKGDFLTSDQLMEMAR